MNDYERAVADIEDAINAAEAIDGVDPDIQDYVDGAIHRLQTARHKAEERI